MRHTLDLSSSSTAVRENDTFKRRIREAIEKLIAGSDIESRRWIRTPGDLLGRFVTCCDILSP